MKIHFSLLAQKEYQEAVSYYDDQNIIFGDQFIEEVDEAINLIISFPHAWSKVGTKLRKYVLKRFPYVIFYKPYDDHIVISAIAHQHRNPSYYLKI